MDKIRTFILCVCLFPTLLWAGDTFTFTSPQQERQFVKLTEELRCLVCQNQSLADSHAPLAEDLRQVIYQELMAGKTPNQIIEFLVARYGDFILYKPPFQGNTYLLWVAPFVLLGVGVLGLVVFVVRQKKGMLS